MDFGSGALETRTFQLDPGVDFLTDALKVTFDWRGRLITPCAVTKSCVFQVRSISLGTSIPVDVSGSGDITVDAQHFPDGLIPDVDIAAVGNGDVNPDPMGTPAIEGTPTPDPVDGGGGGGTDPVDGVDPTPTPTATPTATPTPTPNGNGNGTGGNNGNNGNGNGGNGNATPTPTPASSGQCVASISPSTIIISQSDSTQVTGTAIFTMAAGGPGARTISAAQDGNGNSLVIGLSLVRIDGSGSSTISVTAKNGAGNRGTFSVKVSADPTCGSTQTLTVIVNN
jgi:hypothetical protein